MKIWKLKLKHRNQTKINVICSILKGFDLKEVIPVKNGVSWAFKHKKGDII